MTNVKSTPLMKTNELSYLLLNFCQCLEIGHISLGESPVH